MLLTTLEFSLFSTLHMQSLIKASPRPLSKESNRAGMKFLFGKGGLIRSLAPRYLAYFKPSFHPDEVNSDASRAAALAWLGERFTLPKAA